MALIDYFHDLTLLREGDSINFQKASCTLDGCVKIYTSRVDSVDVETKKLLNGLQTYGKFLILQKVKTMMLNWIEMVRRLES